MHVVLVGAEFEENLAIRYLWGALEAAGHRVTHVVYNRRTELEAAARAIVASRAELCGLSMVFTARGREFADLATRARELGFGGHVVAGGPFAAFYAAELLRDVPALDSVALGEGESILCELASKLDEVETVPGCCPGRRARAPLISTSACRCRTSCRRAAAATRVPFAPLRLGTSCAAARASACDRSSR
jgi:anaerobic magnesium-protoporphyrin IX monomethyl ester cyclase